MQHSKQEIEDIWNDRVNGMKTKEVADKYGLSNSTVYRILKKRSEDSQSVIPRGRKLKNKDIIEIVNIWNSKKMSQKEIADKFNISQTMVSAIVCRRAFSELTHNIHIRNTDMESHQYSETAEVNVVYNPI